MNNPSAKLLKIGEASKLLGVSIDTLRRWEKAGKIKTIRTPGGTRLYSLETLREFNPPPSTEELLKRVEAPAVDNLSSMLHPQTTTLHHPSSIVDKSLLSPFLKGIAVLSTIILVTTALIAGVKLTHPHTANDLFQKLAGNLKNPYKIADLADHLPAVLAVASSLPYLEINSDTQINGNLFIRDRINNLSLEATPSAGILISSGTDSLKITGSSTIDQDLSTASSPAFAGLTFTGTKEQLLVGTGKVTFPNNTSGEVSLLGQKISNSELDNSKVTISPGTNLSGGGDVSLGSSVTLNLKDTVSLSGTLTVTDTTNATSATTGSIKTSGGIGVSKDVYIGGNLTVAGTTTQTGATTFSGQILASDGTVSAPGYSFSSDTDTGIYRSGSNTLDFSSGGVRTLTLATATSGVNYVSITPAATGSGPTIASSGSDTNIPLTVNSVLTGALTLDSTSTGTVNLGTGNNAKTVNVGTGTAGNTINVGTNNTTSDTIAIGSSLDSLALTDAEWSVTTAGLITTADDVAVNGGDITTTATTATLFNTNATTLSLGGAATTALNLGNGSGNYTAINLGSGSGTHTINIAGTGATGADTINIGTGGTGADTITIGNNASSTSLALTSGTGSQTFTSSVVSGTTTSSAFVFSDNSLTSGTGLYLTATGLTSGTGVSLIPGTAMTTGSALGISSATYVHTALNDTGNLVSLSFTDASTNANNGGTTNGLNIASTINTTGAGTKSINGINIASPTKTACTTGACTWTGLSVADPGTLANATFYAATFAGGNVGIGDTSPSAPLEVGDGTDSLQVSSVGDLTFVDANGAASITGPAGGALTVAGGSGVALTLTSNAAATWSTSNGLLTITGDDGITLTASTTAGITGNVPDNITNAIDIQESTNNYINVNTTNSSENISFGNATTNPSFSFLGTGAVTIAGSADGTDALTLTAGDILVSNGDFDLSGGDFNVTLDAGDSANVTKSGANAGDVVSISGTSANAIDLLDLAGTSTADAAADTINGLVVNWTESTDTDTFNAVSIPNTTTTNSTTVALSIGTGWDTVLDSANLDISGAGVISGATGLSSSGTITFSGLTASRFVITDASSNLTATAASSVLLNTLSDETGTGVAVFGTSPEITTSITTGSTTFSLVNNTATTVNFAGGATSTLNIGSTTTGTNAFAADVDLTFASTENLAITNTTQGAADLVSISPTWTGDNTADGIGLTLTYNVSASTSTVYGLNLVNADNTTSTGVIDALALFSNDQATETLADGIIIRHNAASGTLTDALQIENTTAGGTITNAINIIETAGTVTTGINIGTGVGTAIVLQQGESIDNTTDNQINLNVGASGTLLLTSSTTATIGNSAGILTIDPTTGLAVTLTDNTADALDIQESTNNYINVNTTNASENVAFGNATTNPSFSFLGTGAVTIAGSADGTDALILTAGDILVSNGDLDISGGDFNVTLDAGDGVNIAKGAAPTVDVFTINGGTSATDGVDALQLTFTGSNASGNVIDITPSISVNASDTFNVIDIDAFTGTISAAGTLTLNALSVGNLTQSETTGTITATGISVGSGWDSDIAFVDSSVIIDGPASSSITFQDFTTITASSVTALSCSDCIDFDDLENTLDVDEATDINLGANALTVDLDSTGDFSIRDVTTDIATFADTGAITFAPTSNTNLTLTFAGTGYLAATPATYTNNKGAFDIVRGGNFTGTAAETAADIKVAPSLTLTEPGSGTFTWYGANIDMSGIAVTAGVGTSALTSLRIAGVSDADAGTVTGVDIANITATAATENALTIGTGWDKDINFADTSPTVVIADTGTISVTDGTNTLFSILDDTSEGDVTVTGDLAVNGATSADITTSTTTATIFNATATTLSLGGAATTALNIGNGNTAYTAINIGSGTGGNTINLAGTGATGADTINIGTGGTSADTITIGNNASTTSLAFTSGTGSQTHTSSTASGTAFSFVSNSVTTGNAITVSSTGTTTGEILDLTGTWAPTDGSTNEAIDINITHTNTTSADNFQAINLTTTDGTALGNTVYNLQGTLTLTGNAAKVGIGDYQTVTSSSTTGDTLVSFDAASTVTGIIGGATTRSVYGLRSQPTAGAESTAGTTNVYGVYSNATGDVGVGGTFNAYGVYIANGTYDTDGTSTAYGLYIEDVSGADTNVDLAFSASPTVTIGNTGTLTLTDGTNTLFSIADDTSEGDVTVTGDLAVNGATSADITTSTTTATIFNATATTLSLGGAATTALNLGNGSGNYTDISIGSGSGTHTINIAGTGATGADTINIGTGGTGADTITIGSTASTTSIALTAGTNDITFSTTDDIFGYSTQTSGNILTLGANSAVTVAGSSTALQGALIDLATNYTTADDDVTGLNITLDATTDSDATVDNLIGLSISGSTVTVNGTSAAPAWEGVQVTVPDGTTTTGTSYFGAGLRVSTPADTQTTALTTTYVGFDLYSAGALTQNTAAGTINWRGAILNMPNVTQTTGTINSQGLRVVNGSVTTGGDQYMIALGASGVGAGTLTGIDISGITAGAGTERAISFGSGWDADINATTSLELAIGGTNEVVLDGTSLSPSTSDGNALGTTSLMWADLFLASGSVINLNNGDVTLTHGTNTLTQAGGDLVINYSSATALNIQDGSGNNTHTLGSATGVVFNENGADLDFRIESDTNANAFVMDAGVLGGAGNITFGSTSMSSAQLYHEFPAQTAPASSNYFKFAVAGTNALTVPTGTSSLVGSVNIDEPNLVATGTITNAFTLRIANAPTEGTNNYALWVDDGVSRFDGVLLGPDGSTSAPSFSFTNDTNTGVFSATADALGITAGGTEVLRFTNTSEASITFNHTSFGFVSNTADASDSKSILITGGGGSAVSRGGIIRLNGNEVTSRTGYVEIYGGDNSGLVQVFTATGGGATESLRFATGSTVFNENSADIDFRIESDGNANMLVIDAGLNNMAIGEAVDAANLFKVGGTWNPGTADTISAIVFDPSITGSADQSIIAARVAPSFTEAASGTHSQVTSLLVGAPALTNAGGLTTTYSAIRAQQPAFGTGIGATDSIGIMLQTGTISLGNQTATSTNVAGIWVGQQTFTSTTNTRTITNPASIYIEGAPVNGGNVSFSSGPYALLVETGDSRFDGLVSVGISNTASSTAVCSALANNTDPTAGTTYELRDCDSAPATDYMEYYSVEQGVETGDIVIPTSFMVDRVLDGKKEARLAKSTSSYQKQVIGIVSDPALATDFNSIGRDMIKASDNPMPVALNGRVPVKVSLENGPIEVGDYITSSSVPGVGMKATKPGPVVGKALEAFSCSSLVVSNSSNDQRPTTNSCEGKILTFVNISWADPGYSLLAASKLSIDSSGNIGIGTSSPQATLDVAGTVAATAIKTPVLDLGSFKIASSSGSLTIQNPAGQNLFSLDPTGNMKLSGTITSEAGAFDVSEDYPVSDDSIEAGDLVAISPSDRLSGGKINNSSSQSQNSSNQIEQQKSDGLLIESHNLPSSAQSTESQENQSTNTNPHTNTDNLELSNPDKNTGITTDARNTIAALENSPDNALSPDFDNSISTSNIPYIGKSQRPYEKGLLGIVSTRPGITLRGKGEGEREKSEFTRPVALNGRVPVKVSTENGPIEVGDYITSSSIPGVAMKATKPGPVVGKALEAFSCSSLVVSNSSNDQRPTTNSCEGKILTFVNISWADPNQALANLILDEEGNLIIPKLKTEQLVLDSSLNIPDQIGNPESNMANERIDLASKLQTIDEILRQAQDRVATQSASLAENKSATNKLAQELASASAELAQSKNEIDSLKLKLEAPEVLYASGSATLANIKVTSEATVSGMLATYDLNVSNSFKSLGTTSLGSTNIAGDLSIDGTFSIENGSEINVLGTLFLQKAILAESLNIFNGKVIIDKDGKLTAQTITADEYRAAAGKATGQGKILAGQTSAEVSTTIVGENSRILVTPTVATDLVLSVTQKQTGQSFTVTTVSAAPSDISFDWWIVNEIAQIN